LHQGLIGNAAASPPDVMLALKDLTWFAAASPPDVRQGYALPESF
jgi:hypothetical protein